MVGGTEKRNNKTNCQRDLIPIEIKVTLTYIHIFPLVSPTNVRGALRLTCRGRWGVLTGRVPAGLPGEVAGRRARPVDEVGPARPYPLTARQFLRHLGGRGEEHVVVVKLV